MHLYLSSFLLGNRASELASLVRARKAAVVANALDHAKSQIRSTFARDQIDGLVNLGFEAQELDLRDFFKEPARLDSRLDDVGLVWVTGGNTFLLRRAMKQSGLDQYLIERRHSDRLMYGGFSAGACVVAPTLRGIELVDTLDAAADGYSKEIIWDGLGLVPYSIAPHFESDHPESGAVNAMVRHFAEHNLPFVTLRDGDVIVTVAS